MRTRFALLALVAFAPLACSSSDFSTPAVEDSATSADTAVSDGSVEDTGSTVAEGGSGEAGGCAPLSPNPDVIYVDARAAAGGLGSEGCPVQTIKEGLALIAGLASGKRTLKIAGGTASVPLVYNETTALVVKSQTTVVGDGAPRVTITGGGACTTATQGCVLVQEGGSSLEGVTIDAGARVGLTLTPGAFTGAAAKNLIVTNAKGTTNPAAYVKGGGAVDLGPAFRVVKNAGVGLLVDDIFSVHVIDTGATPNSFSNNTGGIVMMKGGLNFDGGEVANNAAAGLSLVATPKHSVTKLDAHDNGGPGIFLEGGAGLKLRRSTLVRNRVGLVVKFGLTVDVDLGGALDPGNNVFGGATDKNIRAAICFANAKATKVNALGNKWPACPLLVAPLGTATCESLGAYQDIYFAPIVPDGMPPIDWGTCG